MKAPFILLTPVLCSIKNDIFRFNRSFYRKIFIYTISSAVFILLITKLLNIGVVKLQNLSPEVFNILLIKGYSFIFTIIFFIQIINGLVVSLNTFFQSKELELLFTSPVNRSYLFFARLFETHLKTSWMLIIFGIPLLLSSGLYFQAGPVYYIFSFVLFMAFLSIPVNIGTGAALLLSSTVHITKLKKFIFSAGVIAVVVMVTLFRIFRPERFANPELFANVTLFLSELRTPSFILLPSRWLSESLFNLLNKIIGDTLIFVFLLLLTAYITVFFLELIFRKYHYRGWSLLQGGGVVLHEKCGRPSIVSHLAKKVASLKPVQRLFSSINVCSGMLLRKDVLYQLRDIKNINQIFILLSLIIIYLFSIASLPLNWEGYAIKLKYIISFFNLGLILIIITALCSRIVYPAIISEGNALWIIKTSPTTPKRYVWTKFIFFFIPLFVFGQLLIIFSSYFIDIEKAFTALNILTTALLCFSLVSMAISFSISDLKNTIGEGEKEEIKTAGIMFMIVSFFFITLTLVLETIPLFLFFLKEFVKIGFTQKTWFIIGAVIFVLLLINILVTVISMQISIKKIRGMEPG